MSATDSLSREFLKLKRLRLNTNVSTMYMYNVYFYYMYNVRQISNKNIQYLQYDSKTLSNVLKVESLHSALREDEAVYWSRYFIDSISSGTLNGSKPRPHSKYVRTIMYAICCNV